MAVFTVIYLFQLEAAIRETTASSTIVFNIFTGNRERDNQATDHRISLAILLTELHSREGLEAPTATLPPFQLEDQSVASSGSDVVSRVSTS